MRRTTVLVLMAMGLAIAPTTASAQLLQLGRDKTYKVGPVKCVKNQQTSNPPFQHTSMTGCTVTNGPERSVFCGTEGWSGKLQYHAFTGCRIAIGPYRLQCGEDISQEDQYYYADHHDIYGCNGSAGAQPARAYCDLRESGAFWNPADYGNYLICTLGVVVIRCKYDPNLGPDFGPCRISIGTLLVCDVDFADPAGSLVACATGAGARRRT